MTNKTLARLKVKTPLGTYYGKCDEINDSKISFQDYVQEITSMITNSPESVVTFTDVEGDVVFIMSETIKNSVVTVEKVG